MTGRTPRAAAIPWRAVRLSAPVISCNGAVVTDPATGHRLLERNLAGGIPARLLALVGQTAPVPVLWTTEAVYASTGGWLSELPEEVN